MRHRRHRLGSIPFCRISNCIPHNHLYWSYNRRGNNREWNRPDLLADTFHSSSLFRPETIGGVQSQERLAAASLVRSVNPKQERIQPGRMRLSQRVAEVSEVDFPSWEPAMTSGAIHNSRDLLQRPARGSRLCRLHAGGKDSNLGPLYRQHFSTPSRTRRRQTGSAAGTGFDDRQAQV